MLDMERPCGFIFLLNSIKDIVIQIISWIITMLRMLIVHKHRFAFGKNAGFDCHILCLE